MGVPVRPLTANQSPAGPHSGPKTAYSALIRTFNSEHTLPVTLASLERQTNPPHQYIFVDSGSTDRTLASLPAGALVHRYEGEVFNFAAAINQGLRLVTNHHVLIISSHTELRKPKAMDYALALLNSNADIGAAYFADENHGPLRHKLIGRHNFTGFNGVWNTCAVIKFSLLQKRHFRSEVFAAEDQEWSAWLLTSEGKMIARISGSGLAIHNPRRHSLRKRLNEYVAVAYFANRKLLAWPHIYSLLKQAVHPASHIGRPNRKFNLLLSARLATCHIFKPHGKSRYY